MTDTMIPCACTKAKEFNFNTPDAARRSYQLALSLLDHRKCDHVGIDDLLPRECQACAVFFSNCFDKDREKLKCIQEADSTLLLFALRPIHAAKFTKTVTTTIVVMSAPAHSLSIEGADNKDENDKSRYLAGSEVLRPYFHGFTENQYWSKKIPIRVQRTVQAVVATINVRFEVDHGSETILRAITLDVNVPPERALAEPIEKDLIRTEEEKNMVEPMSTAILTESVKILLSAGWDFFKKHGPLSGDNEIIALNIGSASITEDSASPGAVDRLVGGAAPMIKVNLEPLLRGLKINFDDLVAQKGYLIANKGSAKNPVEESHVDHQIGIVDRKIFDAQRQIWEALRSTGQFSVGHVPRG
jgi:hypothetical protein